MRYEKPEVVVLASAVKAITMRQLGKPTGVFQDFWNPQSPIHTNGAYEADE